MLRAAADEASPLPRKRVQVVRHPRSTAGRAASFLHQRPGIRRTDVRMQFTIAFRDALPPNVGIAIARRDSGMMRHRHKLDFRTAVTVSNTLKRTKIAEKTRVFMKKTHP